jgi:hypothetical protein
MRLLIQLKVHGTISIAGNDLDNQSDTCPLEIKRGHVRRTASSSFVLALLLGFVCLPAGGVIATQQTFKIQKASNKYDIIANIDSCDKDDLPDVCSGSGHINVFKKGEDTPFQVIDQDNLWFDKVKTSYNPLLDAKRRVLYDDEYSLIVGDFNFDGEEDLAIRNGHNGGYGAPSYTIYLFQKRSRRFAENKEFSDLADGVYLGMFFPDSRRKVLHGYWKSGAGYHVEEIYTVIHDRPVLIEKTEQEATVTGLLIVTTHKRINGKWVKTVKTRKINWPKGAASTLKYNMIDTLKSFNEAQF